MNLLLLTAHSIAEYDDLRMFSDMGVDVFSIGAYTDPANPGDGMRPALPLSPAHPDLAALCDEQRAKHAGDDTEWAVDWAKADLHPDIIAWADVIVCHHYLDRWIVPQWLKFTGKRVIWRTCGQSDPRLERLMTPFARKGLQIVRYSPKERATFERLGVFAGEDALIRFGKYPDDYGPWIGDGEFARYNDQGTLLIAYHHLWVGNVTQDMIGRGSGGFDATGYRFWLAATEGLPARPAGPHSERLPGGIGALGYDEMREYLRRCRAYLYTGTVPASYTLGLIEAMLSGVPVVSIGPDAWAGPSDLFEYELSGFIVHDTAESAKWDLKWLLASDSAAKSRSLGVRQRAVSTFGIDRIAPQWAAFLGWDIPETEAERAAWLTASSNGERVEVSA